MKSPDTAEFVDRFSTVSRCLRSVAADAYAAFDVGSVQAKFLRYIGRDGPMSQAELARATLTAPTLTGRAIETLVERGWVRRRRSKEDRRQYVLELTASGQRTRERVEEARDAIVARVGAILDERDHKDFERIATKILDALANG